MCKNKFFTAEKFSLQKNFHCRKYHWLNCLTTWNGWEKFPIVRYKNSLLLLIIVCPSVCMCVCSRRMKVDVLDELPSKRRQMVWEIRGSDRVEIDSCGHIIT